MNNLADIFLRGASANRFLHPSINSRKLLTNLGWMFSTGWLVGKKKRPLQDPKLRFDVFLLLRGAPRWHGDPAGDQRGEMVRLCSFSSFLFAYRTFQPNGRDVRVLQIHQEPVDVVIDVTRVARFHPWQILAKNRLFSTSLASPRWVLDGKEKLNY